MNPTFTAPGYMKHKFGRGNLLNITLYPVFLPDNMEQKRNFSKTNFHQNMSHGGVNHELHNSCSIFPRDATDQNGLKKVENDQILTHNKGSSM